MYPWVSGAIPIPTVGIPVGYEQGASVDEGDNDNIVA